LIVADCLAYQINRAEVDDFLPKAIPLGSKPLDKAKKDKVSKFLWFWKLLYDLVVLDF
jgi:hypothetical protein